MKPYDSLAGKLFGAEQCGGVTKLVEITKISQDLCSKIERISTENDTTEIIFDPPLPTKNAIMQAQKYTERGSFMHT